MLTDPEVAAKATFAPISLTGGVLAERGDGAVREVRRVPLRKAMIRGRRP
jgi:hypothetical protein